MSVTTTEDCAEKTDRVGCIGQTGSIIYEIAAAGHDTIIKAFAIVIMLFPRVTLMNSCSMPVPINFCMQLVRDAPGKSLPQLPDMPFLPFLEMPIHVCIPCRFKLFLSGPN